MKSIDESLADFETTYDGHRITGHRINRLIAALQLCRKQRDSLALFDITIVNYDQDLAELLTEGTTETTTGGGE